MRVFIPIVFAWSYSALGFQDWWEPEGTADSAECTTKEDSLGCIIIHYTEPCLGPLLLEDILNDFGSDGHFSKIEYYFENKSYLILTNVRIKNGSLRQATVEHGALELYGRVYQAGEKVRPPGELYNKENCF